MNLSSDDTKVLQELCDQHGVMASKVLKLLQTVQEYEFKDRRTGIYDALRDVLRSSTEMADRGKP